MTDSPDVSPLDAATLDSLRDLGGDEFLAELATLFLQDAPVHLTSITEALNAKDADAVARAAHALKSAAANMGAKRLQELLSRLEHAGRTGSLDDAAVLAGEIQHEYVRVGEAMERLQNSA